MPASLENTPADDITPEQILELIAERTPENNRLEYKQEPVEAKETRKILSAMANDEGGHLIIGIVEDGEDCADEIIDVQEAIRVVTSTRDAALDCIEPRLQGLTVHSIVVEGQNVVVCHVPESSRKPHAVTFPENGRRYYRRYQRTTRPMTDDEVRQAYQGDVVMRAVGKLNQQVEALAQQMGARTAQAALQAELDREVDEAELRNLREPEAHRRHAERLFRAATDGAPYFRLTATPLPLGRIDLRDRAQDLAALFHNPPSYRQLGFDLDLGIADEGERQTRAGLIRRNLAWKHLRVLWNGHTEYWGRADSTWASWGEREQGDLATRPFSPLVLIETTACFVAFVKRVCELANHTGTVEFQLGLYNIAGRQLMPYPIGTYSHNDGGLARLGDDTIGEFQDTDYIGDPVEALFNELPGDVPFRLISQMYNALGYTREHIPYFDDETNEFLPLD